MKKALVTCLSAAALIVGCGDDTATGGGATGGGGAAGTGGSPTSGGNAATGGGTSDGGGGAAAGVELLDPTQDQLGKSYKEWAGAWWQWAYGLPATNHPLLDDTGEFCAAGQTGDMFFLGGTFGGTPVTRSCTIPASKTIFFPIVNTTWDNAGLNPVDYSTDAENQAGASTFIDSVDDYSLEIDGTSWTKAELQPYRVGAYQSTYDVPATDSLYDLFGFPVEVSGTVDPTFGDGIYAMVALPPGAHTIHISALATQGTPDTADDFAIDVSYNLTIQ